MRLNSFCSATSSAMLKKRERVFISLLSSYVLAAYKVFRRLRGICFQCIVSTRFTFVRPIGNLAI